ncbi:MAG: hypothetical protein ABIO43_11200 [Sphingomicrobium sp.]
MFRSISLIALALASVPASAAETGTRIVSVDGDRIEYVTRLDAGDIVVIDGRSIKGHDPLHLVVAPSGRVRGEIGATPVSFMISKAHRERVVRQLRAQVAPSVAMAASAVAPSVK